MATNARDLIAVVAPAVDLAQLSRIIVASLEEHATVEREIADAERALGTATERRRRLALDIGRALVDARKGFPRSGPNAAGWGRFLAEAGLGERTARRWMDLAGYVEVSDTVSENSAILPSARTVQVAKAGIGPAVLPSQRIRLAPSANLPTPSRPSPTVHRDAPRTIRGESQAAPEDGEPVYQIEPELAPACGMT